MTLRVVHDYYRMTEAYIRGGRGFAYIRKLTRDSAITYLSSDK